MAAIGTLKFKAKFSDFWSKKKTMDPIVTVTCHREANEALLMFSHVPERKKNCVPLHHSTDFICYPQDKSLLRALCAKKKKGSK